MPRGGGNFIVDRSSWRSNGGGALALYALLWQLGGVSDADGFAALATAAIKGVVSATTVMRQRRDF